MQTNQQVEESKKSDVIGIVSGCIRLCIHEKPDTDSDILAAIPAGSEVVVDEVASTDTFYQICNAAGIQGFCMKNYIQLRR